MTSTEYNPVVSLPAPFEVPVTEAAVPVLLATTTEPFASVEVTAFVGCTLPLAPEAVDTARSPRNNVTLEVTSVDAVEKVPTTTFSTIVQSPITQESVPQKDTRTGRRSLHFQYLRHLTLLRTRFQKYEWHLGRQ